MEHGWTIFGFGFLAGALAIDLAWRHVNRLGDKVRELEAQEVPKGNVKAPPPPPPSYTPPIIRPKR